MATVQFQGNQVIVSEGQSLTQLYLILKGSVEVSFPGGSYVIGKGDVIGICEAATDLHLFTYKALEETTAASYSYSGIDTLEYWFQAKIDLAGLFCLSISKQIAFLLQKYNLMSFEYSMLYHTCQDDYESYRSLCKQHMISPVALSAVSEFEPLDDEQPIEEWLMSYYEGLYQFFLTGGALGPAELCSKLTEAGLGDLKVWIGEKLSYKDEIILAGKAAEYTGYQFNSLSVMLAESAPCKGDMTPGMDDEEFIRGDIPMTKQIVRAAIISKMSAGETDTIWDVGAGTGSVSVELAMKAARGRVWAIEREPEGCMLIEENKKKLGVWNLNVAAGSAPEVLADLPAPDRVFIGGSDGNLEAIIDAVLAKNDKALICISAIVLETMSETVKLMTERGMNADIIQVCVNTSRKIGDRHMMMAGNPVFIITGQKAGEGEAADA